MSIQTVDQPPERRKAASTYHPVRDLAGDEIIRQARRELANRYGSRGTTDQLRIAIMVLEDTRGGEA